MQCTKCKTSEFNNPKACTAVIILNKNDDILIAHRARNPGKDKLDVPGGYVNTGESAEEAAIRELEEETGLKVDQNRLKILKTCMNDYLFQDKYTVNLDVLFRLNIANGVELLPGDDVAKLEWIKPTNIDFSNFWSDHLANSIQSYLKSQNML